ncbi:MAG TPA: Crp/Fnr family transcriptional regulator [Pseudolabrys sp.]
MAKASNAHKAEAFLLNVGVGRTNEIFHANDVIFSQGDAAAAVFYIRKGTVKVAVTSEHGKDAVLAIMGPGDFFGQCCLSGPAHRTKTVMALDECVVLRIDKAAMLREFAADPEFSSLFMTYLLDRNRRIEDDLADQLFNSSEKRLARALLLLVNSGQDGNADPVIAKIRQETLAEMVGTTRSRISFFMNKFRRLGFIAYEGGVHGALRVNISLLNMVLQGVDLAAKE